jgi:hypothetical protein
MALSIVFKHALQQLPRKYASGFDSEGDETLKALMTLSATSRSMRDELDSAVDVRTLRQEVESLRILHREAVWDAQIKSWGNGRIIAGVDVPWSWEFQQWTCFLKTFGPVIQVRASWIMKTFRCVMAQDMILRECGHCPVACFENGRVVVKPFVDVTFDDVMHDPRVHGRMPLFSCA